MTESWIFEANEKNFEQEVIERSRRTPVLVDFWAPWCGPCKMLGPLLESAVAARGGSVWLAKVNVDENPGLASAFGVQGIPVVKAFIDGLIVDELVGVRDRRGIEAFIDSVVPSEQERALDRAEGLLSLGRPEEVPELLKPLIEEARYRERALLLQARAFAAQRRFDDAEVIIDQVLETNPADEAARGMRLRIDMVRSAQDNDISQLRERIAGNPKDLEARWALAGLLLDRDEIRAALEELLEILMRDRTFRDDGARRAMLAIFEHIGINDDISHEYRKQMQIYL